MAMPSRRRVLQYSGIAAGIGLAGCIGGDSDDDDTISIGALQPFSGPFSVWGNEHQEGVEYAIDEINENGGVLGRELSVVDSDTGSDARDAVTLFQQFAEADDIVAAVGPVSSDVGVQASQTAEDLGVPLFLHMAGDHQILTRDSRYTFRTSLLPGPTNIAADAEFVEDRGYSNIGAIIGDYAWGRAIEEAMEELIVPLDGVDLDIQAAPAGEDDFTSYLRNMPDGVEAVIAGGHPPGSPTIFQTALELDMGLGAVTASNYPGNSFYGTSGDDIEQGLIDWRLISPEDDDYLSKAEEFTEETGEHFTTTTARGYGTVQLIKEAIEIADSTDHDEIGDALRENEFDLIWSSPLNYTEWGELDGVSQIYVEFEAEAPDHYPDGDWRMNEVYRTDPLDPLDPDDWD